MRPCTFGIPSGGKSSTGGLPVDLGPSSRAKSSRFFFPSNSGGIAKELVFQIYGRVSIEVNTSSSLAGARGAKHNPVILNR
jgi:hypothetical protein